MINSLIRVVTDSLAIQLTDWLYYNCSESVTYFVTLLIRVRIISGHAHWLSLRVRSSIERRQRRCTTLQRCKWPRFTQRYHQMKRQTVKKAGRQANSQRQHHRKCKLHDRKWRYSIIHYGYEVSIIANSNFHLSSTTSSTTNDNPHWLQPHQL